MDLTGRDFWNKNWKDNPSSTVIDVRRSYIYYRYDQIFSEFFERQKNMKLLEVGCGNSSWLPYFRTKFGYEVWGIDYSKEGVESALEKLSLPGSDGNIIYGDIFAQGLLQTNTFDIIVSFGLIEHFSDTSPLINRIVDLMKVNGVLLTSIPNFSGAMGKFQKLVNNELYLKHVVYDKEDLFRIHRIDRLEPLLNPTYFGCLDLNVVRWNKTSTALKVMNKIAITVNRCIHYVLKKTGYCPESQFFSPYIVGVYRKIKD